MKNKLVDLNNHLFAQLERLSDEDLSGDALLAEVKRTEAIVDVSDQIMEGAKLQLQAVKLVAEYDTSYLKHLPMLTSSGVTQAMIEGERG